MNANYLQQLNAARAKESQEVDIQKAMEEFRKSSSFLKGFGEKEIAEIDEVIDKFDSFSKVFDKLAKMQSKLEEFTANIELLKDYGEPLQDDDTDTLPNCTANETYAIQLQLVKEFETESRLSKDLLKLSETQKLDGETPDEIPEYANITKEQTVQVYMQVIHEFENQTELAKRLAYNAGGN